jgi:hypothetical protein
MEALVAALVIAPPLAIALLYRTRLWWLAGVALIGGNYSASSCRNAK